MSGRSLAYLAGIDIEMVKGVGPRGGRSLREAGVATVADLLLHVPRRHVDRSKRTSIAELPLGEETTVVGEVKKVSVRRVRRGLVIVDVTVYDGESYLFVTFFNQAFRQRQLSEGTEVALSGKAERFRGRLQMKSPVVDVLGKRDETRHTGRIVPIYPSAGGVASWRLERFVGNALSRSRPLEDPVPSDVLARLDLVDRDVALASIHFPDTTDDAEVARRRLIFDELFRLEVALALRKQRQAEDADGIAHMVDSGLVEDFVGSLPYRLTGAQERVIGEIRRDMAGIDPMHRLLQGEVGSGKTVVAMAALLYAVQGGYQGAVMAPTEVLAEQHHIGLEPLASLVGVRMGLLTGSSPDRQKVLAAVADGAIDVVIGTHALIQDGVRFARLGMAVVDEQHRFGVHQRVELRNKSGGPTPDMLIMTATPIPRTLSMTLYGDLDVSLLDEMPLGRIPVATRVIGHGDIGEAYDLIRGQAAAGRQAFVVCPLVDDSPKLQAASATAEYERLTGVFADLRVGLLHGQMRSADKEGVMAAMRAGDLDVLVATTVIEVGIDIANATVMVVEDADRFGLSQLHQLRGRVGRGEHPSTCLLVADPTTPEGEMRLAAMAETNDGFRLAEEDLRIRGQGTVFGARQAGLADLKMADVLRDTEILIAARREAFALVAADPGLGKHPALAAEVLALLGEEVAWLFLS